MSKRGAYVSDMEYTVNMHMRRADALGLLDDGSSSGASTNNHPHQILRFCLPNSIHTAKLLLSSVVSESETSNTMRSSSNSTVSGLGTRILTQETDNSITADDILNELAESYQKDRYSMKSMEQTSKQGQSGQSSSASTSATSLLLPYAPRVSSVSQGNTLLQELRLADKTGALQRLKNRLKEEGGGKKGSGDTLVFTEDVASGRGKWELREGGMISEEEGCIVF